MPRRSRSHRRVTANIRKRNFHRKRRGRKGLADPLEAVEGLGAKRLQALLRHFGGRRGIDHASRDDLSAVDGIGVALAERIWEEIH